MNERENSRKPANARPAVNGGAAHPRRRAPRKQSPGDERTRIQAALGSDAASLPPEKRGRVKPGIVVRVVILNMLKAFVVLCCLGLMVGCVVGAQVAQFVVETTENDDQVMDLDILPTILDQTSYLMAMRPEASLNREAAKNSSSEEYWEVHQELVDKANRVWVPLADIPQYLQQAVVAVEDETFWEHHGVNFARSAFALINEFVNIRDQFGASTLDQQLVKNITGEDVVEDASGNRTAGYMRKIVEMLRAWRMNNAYDKTAIMEAYLNTISLSERLAGVEAGAQNYFGKPAKDLTLAECATIAGITRAPTYYSPIQNPENARNRRNYVLETMYTNGYISAAQKAEAQALPLGLAPRRQQESIQTGNTGVFSYAADKVFNDVIADYMAKYNTSYTQARDDLYNNGWKVYMTVDQRVQAALDDIMVDGYEEGGYFMDEARFPGYRNSLTQMDELTNPAGVVIDETPVLPQAAAAVINYYGELIATNGAIGPKENSLSLNRSMGTVRYAADGSPYVDGTVRQVGSTMKPIAAYALGIEYGIISYSTMVKDDGLQPRNVSSPTVNAEGQVVNDWPRNYTPGYRGYNIPIVSAIAESTNTVAVQVGMYVKREAMFDYLTNVVGITSLVNPSDVDWAPLVLGSMTYGLSVYELAGAYMVFGGNDTYGEFTTLHSYFRVEDANGNVVLEPEVFTKRALDPQTGYVMNRLLANVIRPGYYPGGASPTAGGMLPTHPDGEMDAVAKTGTTSDDKDRLFVGLTPYYVTAVWWGYDNPQQHDFYGKWNVGARTNIPVNVWKSLMETVQAELPIIEFPEPPPEVTHQAYCARSGLLLGPGCPSGGMGYYTNFGPLDVCKGGHEEEPPPAA